jgi:hypothetical protein
VPGAREPMTALVTVETALLVLLVVLVAGLLRSHAEVLRRLGPPSEDGDPAADSLAAPSTRAGDQPATDIVGRTLDGDAVKVALTGAASPTLLAFLTSGCETCKAFWESFGSERSAGLPAGVRLVAVTKDGSHESPARLRDLAPDGVPVVLSTSAWDAYAVPGSPYFVYVEGGRVAGEGAATGWDQLASLLRDALDDARLAQQREAAEPSPVVHVDGGSRASGQERAVRADRALQSAGIGRGHPSLYPAGRDDDDPPA